MHASGRILDVMAGQPVIFASIFSGDTLDAVANYIAIFVLFFVPAVLIYLFWTVHIMPEKIAYRRGHPQAGTDVVHYPGHDPEPAAEDLPLTAPAATVRSEGALAALFLYGEAVPRAFSEARQLVTQYDLIAIRNGRLANRVALHLALGGGFVATP